MFLNCLSEVESSRGKKRQNPMSVVTVAESKSRGDIQHSSTPLCRPWDRGDLMQRLATFKSMTWFAKPEVVSAINCARRGWVNVDMDIIACEACGARLLFSAPSSWTRQQVEKAALVFSLKLDNGHRLLCPWINNACDEELAQFPPATVQDLIDGYRERASALLKLTALPSISSAAIGYMRSPQLEHFLGQSSMLECGTIYSNMPQTEYIGSQPEAIFYFQAQKLISLCGWEPRSLPYVVDCKDQSYQPAKDANLLNLSHVVANVENPSINICSMPDEINEANEDPMAYGKLQSDPCSVVLDCRLCGASVGLWAFSTVPCPVEFFRVAGYSEVNGENSSSHCKENIFSSTPGASKIQGFGTENHVNSREGTMSTASNSTISSSERLLSHLTIAGGPPPTKQNFKATISLPVIGRNLRARFSYDSDFRDRKYPNQDKIQFDSLKKDLFKEGNNHIENSPTGQVVHPELTGQLKNKRNDGEPCNSTNGYQSPSLKQSINEEVDATRKENNTALPLEGPKVVAQGLSFPETDMHDLIEKSETENAENVIQGSVQNDKLADSTGNVEMVNPAVEKTQDVIQGSQVRDSCILSPDANVTTKSGDDCNLQPIPGSTDILGNNIISRDGNQESSCVGSCMERNIDVDAASEGEKCSDAQNNLDMQLNSHGGNVDKDRGQKEGFACGIAKDPKQLPLDKAMEFDPIRQHRHFCPWIASADSAAPGWKQTLSALQRGKEFSPYSPSKLPSLSMIEVDDPIASIRKLFASPSAKRMKLTHGSS
ncbi:uncharacterized protein LOC117933853 isoform X2 [Vitis riparia]|uniref:uncharacterized protein LOC117933853 isoform X2 n=1 Tax=Vitis riparia TaxID=96939 RepID=UPI00155B3228|nr:uncharacterized protein LOC117933853 isoform X2 [Vitis riparia]